MDQPFWPFGKIKIETDQYLGELLSRDKLSGWKYVGYRRENWASQVFLWQPSIVSYEELTLSLYQLVRIPSDPCERDVHSVTNYLDEYFLQYIAVPGLSIHSDDDHFER